MSNAQGHPLNLEDLFSALRTPLGLVDDPQRREDLQRYFDAAQVHLERAVVDLVSDVVGVVNEASSETHFSLGYESRQLRLTHDAAATQDEPLDPNLRMDGDLDKVTIRLPRKLKELIDTEAGARGVSLNGWYVEALAHAISHQMRHRSRREELRGEGWAAFPFGRRGGRRGGRGEGRSAPEAD